MEKRRFTDFFDLLDVDRNASKSVVQKAFMLKASIWHPDKAEKDEDREYYTKIYQDLQTAYRILSNDNSRRQYLDAQQTTDLEFKTAERDVGYATTDQFKTDQGKFDENAFHLAFQSTRDDKEQENLDSLHTKYRDETKLQDTEIQDFLARRAAETETIGIQQVFSGTGVNFDSDTFNRAFDLMKERDPGNGVQLYEGDPMAMFSGAGVVECDPMSGINFTNGLDFTGHNVNDLVLGQSNNPGRDFDLKALQTGAKYGVESKLTDKELQEKMSNIQAHRDQLANMDKTQFIVEPSEIEKQYADLFAPMNVEGLEAPIQHAGAQADAPAQEPSQTSAPSHLPRNSTNIRKKIEQRKTRITPKSNSSRNLATE